MKQSLFITGATGFIGTHLLDALDLNEFAHIYCIGRAETPTTRRLSRNVNFTFLQADIFNTALYSHCLESSDTVLHIAAITGKAKPEEYLRVNTSGTETLLKECKKAGINRFIFISSIAVTFRDLKHYYYAHSKIKAEAVIRACDIPYTIIRPTIVIGENASILSSLQILAKAPLVPIFGSGATMIQPIYVKDLALFILSTVRTNCLENKAVDVGGPEKISMENFIHKIHRLSYEKNFRPIHLPVGPIKAALAGLEKVILPLLPITAGQLASFTNDGVTENSRPGDSQENELTRIDEMLALSLPQAYEKILSNDRLEKECRMFTTYLIGQHPDRYMYEKYRKGHEVLKLYNDTGFFNRLLIRLARQNTFFTRLADVYTTIFCRKSLLKKKLALLLAILECRTVTYNRLDFADGGSLLLLYLNLGRKIAGFALMFLLSFITLGPIHLSWSICSRFNRA